MAEAIVPSSRGGSAEFSQVHAVRLENSNPPLFFEDNTTAGSVTLLSYRAGLVEGQVVADRPDALVFSEVSYPGWTAYVDGQKQTPGLFQDTFQTAQVPAGRHIVRFEYAPLTFRAGLAITLATLSLLGFGITFRFVRSKRLRPSRR